MSKVVNVQRHNFVQIKGGYVPLLLNHVHKYPIKGHGIQGNSNVMVGMAPSSAHAGPELKGGTLLNLDNHKINPINFLRTKKAPKVRPIEFKF